jgi:hypothetical protein
MSEKILKQTQAKTIYDSLVAANDLGVRHFRVDFERANHLQHTQENITFAFYETSTSPNVGISMVVDSMTVARESYATQHDFARAYGLQD